jgi:hypothetical protein
VPVIGFEGSLLFVPLLNIKPIIGIIKIKLYKDTYL